MYITMSADSNFCSNYFTINVQTNMLYTNLYSDTCQLYFNKTGKNERKEAEEKIENESIFYFSKAFIGNAAFATT